MKKVLLNIIILLVFLPRITFGQDKHAGPLWVGPKIGLQASQVFYQSQTFSEQYLHDLQPGFNAGVNISVLLTETFRLHSEIYYSRKGKILRKNNTMQWVDGKVVYHHLDIPALFRMDYHKSPVISYFINFGPFVSFFLGGNAKVSSDIFTEYSVPQGQKYKFIFI